MFLLLGFSTHSLITHGVATAKDKVWGQTAAKFAVFGDVLSGMIARWTLISLPIGIDSGDSPSGGRRKVVRFSNA
jgi:hypothetical protein